MDSKTLSKVEQLRGFQALADNQFYQMLSQACEVNVQGRLSQLLAPDRIKSQDDLLQVSQDLAVMQGLRSPHAWLQTIISQLRLQVEAETDPTKQPVQPSAAESEADPNVEVL